MIDIHTNGVIKCDNREDTFRMYQTIMGFQTTRYTEWIKECRTNEDFEFGKQWSDEERDRNAENGNFTITINLIEKAIDFMSGMLTARMPKMSATPIGTSNSYYANVAIKILDWIGEKSGGIDTIRQWVHDGLSHNISYQYVEALEDDTVRYTTYCYEDIIVDPASRDSLFKDAKEIFIKKVMSINDIKAIYGIDDDIAMDYPSEWASSGHSGSKNIVPGTEFDTEIKYDNYSNMEAGRLFDANNEYGVVYIGFKKIKVREQNGKVKTRILRRDLIGYDRIYQQMLPYCIDEYPIIPFYVKGSRNPYKIGKIESIREVQKYINKLHGVMLKNVMQLGSPKIAVPDILIPDNDPNSFINKLSSPGAVVITRHVEGAQISTISGQPVPDSMMTMFQNAMSLIEYQTAPKQSMGYQDSNSTQSAQSMIGQKELAIDSFKLIAGRLEAGINQLAKVSLQFFKAFITNDTVIDVTNGIEVIERININKKMKLDVTNEESIAKYYEYVKQSGKSIEEADIAIAKAKDDKGYADVLYEYTTNASNDIDVHLKVISESYTPSYQSAEYAIMQQLVQAGSIPPDALIDVAPISNREEVKANANIVKRLLSQVNNSNTTIEQMTAKLDEQKKTIERLELEMIKTNEQARFEKIHADQMAKKYANKVNMQTDRVIAKKDIQLIAELTKNRLESIAKAAEDDYNEESKDKSASAEVKLRQLL